MLKLKVYIFILTSLITLNQNGCLNNIVPSFRLLFKIVLVKKINYIEYKFYSLEAEKKNKKPVSKEENYISKTKLFFPSFRYVSYR